MLGFPGEVMELGRSCVHPDYRNRAAMQLLWRGIAAYVFLHRIDLMFGCASLPGTDPDAVATELTYLYHHHLAPPALRPRALPHRYVDMRRLDPAALDPRRALAQAAAADQGLSAPGRLRRRRRGDRRAVQHHRRRRGGEDRPGDRQILPALRTAVRGTPATEDAGRCGRRRWPGPPPVQRRRPHEPRRSPGGPAVPRRARRRAGVPPWPLVPRRCCRRWPCRRVHRHPGAADHRARACWR